MTPYYLVVEEWNYPTESGREVYADTFDTKAEALAKCELIAKDEFVTNFAAAVGQDALPPGRCEDGTLVTTKMGLDPFYYYARVITVEPTGDGLVDAINKKAKSIRVLSNCSYTVVEKRMYPDGERITAVDADFSSMEYALAHCERLIGAEYPRFIETVKQDTVPPYRFGDGLITTTKTLEPFYYYYVGVMPIGPYPDVSDRDIDKLLEEQNDHKPH